ncbi:hypothetical protein, partial [Streptomyces sp. NPDC059003]|uniref:hypothetical protein n=1 Tax=Streptomyces sp. NPDC059003 TaxID=3346691 RepID=UPI003680B646
MSDLPFLPGEGHFVVLPVDQVKVVYGRGARRRLRLLDTGEEHTGVVRQFRWPNGSLPGLGQAPQGPVVAG